MHFSLVSLFPDFFSNPLKLGVVGQAFEKGNLTYSVHNPRNFAEGTHKHVDDRPFGGGDGMVMEAESLGLAIDEARASQHGAKLRVISFSPQGKPLKQGMLQKWLEYDHLVLICGRYSGIDERVNVTCVDEEVSLGDFILSGGEAAALCVIDGVGRLIQNTLGNSESAKRDTYSIDSVFEAPLFTRPNEWRGLEVPKILLSGNHQKIAEFNRMIGLARAIKRRPELTESIDHKLRARALEFVKSLSERDKKILGFSEDSKCHHPSP